MKERTATNKQQGDRVSRRNFMGGAAAAALALSTVLSKGQEATKSTTSKGKFKLKYAPQLVRFTNLGGEDVVGRIKFIADEGFTAIEDNKMRSRGKEEQEKIASQMSKLNLTMGVFVANGKFFKEKCFVTNDKAIREELVQDIKDAVEVAKRVNAKWMTTILGAYDPGLEWGYQTANVIENLKWCAKVCEPAGVVMVLETLNPWKDHPGLFLSKIPQAYEICRAVGSPSCKILDDLYHQQITEGNLIPNIDMAWDEIAYIQVGDNPGRKEPTTGEINYKNIFKHLFEKGYKGVIGMEHGNSKPGAEGEKAVIEAYRYCDDF